MNVAHILLLPDAILVFDANGDRLTDLESPESRQQLRELAGQATVQRLVGDEYRPCSLWAIT